MQPPPLILEDSRKNKQAAGLVRDEANSKVVLCLVLVISQNNPRRRWFGLWRLGKHLVGNSARFQELYMSGPR